MKRQLLSIFLSLTMILSMVPSVWAADETQQDDTDDTAAQETKTPAESKMNGDCGATKEDTVTWKLEQNNTDDALTFDVELCVPLPETAKPGGEPGVMRTLNLGV